MKKIIKIFLINCMLFITIFKVQSKEKISGEKNTLKQDHKINAAFYLSTPIMRTLPLPIFSAGINYKIYNNLFIGIKSGLSTGHTIVANISDKQHIFGYIYGGVSSSYYIVNKILYFGFNPEVTYLAGVTWAERPGRDIETIAEFKFSNIQFQITSYIGFHIPKATHISIELGYSYPGYSKFMPAMTMEPELENDAPLNKVAETKFERYKEDVKKIMKEYRYYIAFRYTFTK